METSRPRSRRPKLMGMITLSQLEERGVDPLPSMYSSMHQNSTEINQPRPVSQPSDKSHSQAQTTATSSANRKRKRYPGTYKIGPRESKFSIMEDIVTMQTLEPGWHKPRTGTSLIIPVGKQQYQSSTSFFNSTMSVTPPASHTIPVTSANHSFQHDQEVPLNVPDPTTDTFTGATQSTSTSRKAETTYSKYRRKREEKWQQLRPVISRAITEEQAPSHYQCLICGDYSDDIIRCDDCGSTTYFCQPCCVQHHKHITLHQPRQWQCDQFVPFLLPPTMWQRSGHTCDTLYTKPLIIVDHKGCPHQQSIQFCHCEDETVTLVRHRFWPSTPLNPGVAISMALLSSLRSLVFAGEVSLTAFTASLRYLYEAQYLQHPHVLKMLTWDTVLNFMVIHHEISHLENICSDLTPTQNCPVCPKEKKIVAMDGNFSLVHRRRDGVNPHVKKRHPSRFFLDQQEVDAFVNGYKDVAQKRKDCSNFQAGDMLRTKNKSDKLDVKGVFGSVCRHDYPLHFFDLKHGERIAYPVYLFNHLKNSTKLLMYDIACQMECHLKKRIQLPDHITLAVPTFHVYGHQMRCQVCYNPRRIKGAGLSDGEGTERLWSYLGDFSNITKEMTQENRHDLLTELLLHYSVRLTNKMVESLCQKMMRACILVASTEQELTQLISALPGNLTRESLYDWDKAEIQRLQSHIPTIQPDDKWKNTYVLQLHDFYACSEKIAAAGNDVGEDHPDDIDKLSRLEAKLCQIERKQRIHRWAKDSEAFSSQFKSACALKRRELLQAVRDEVIQYVFIRETRKKYADGQALAKKITKQLMDSSRKMDKAIQHLNAAPRDEATIGDVTRQEAMLLDSNIYLDVLDPETDMTDNIPRTTKRKAIDVLNLNCRAREEVILLSGDMVRFVDSIVLRQDVLLKKLLELQDKEILSRFDKGAMSLMQETVSRLKALQDVAKLSFAPVLSETPLCFSKFVEHMNNLDVAGVPKRILPESTLMEIDLIEQTQHNEETELTM